MPTLNNLGFSDQLPTLDNLGRYIPTEGPLALTGRARGSPGGLPYQASEVSPFALTRERIQRELEDNPATARQFDINTTAEVGTNPEARRKYQAATMDRAVSTLKSLRDTISNPAYYPARTQNYRTASGLGVDPALWEGANPANYATGNASYDPKTGRWVGFAGGPQTSMTGSGAIRGTELYGIEGPQGLEYARIMGYTGPAKTPIGPAGPRGDAVSNEPLPPAPASTTWQTTSEPLPAVDASGWQATVGTDVPEDITGGVKYAPAQPAAQAAAAASEQPAQEQSSFLRDFFGALGTIKPMKRPAPVEIPTVQLGAGGVRFAPIGDTQQAVRSF